MQGNKNQKQEIWNVGYGRLAQVAIDPMTEQCVMTDARNFSYPNKKEQEPQQAWFDMKFSLQDITKAVVYTVPFFFTGVAHVMLGFEINGQMIVVSPELRYRKGQVFSFKQVLLRKNTLCYLWGAESDLIHLRKYVRSNEPVYRWGLSLGAEQVKNLFLDVVERSNAVNTNGERYHLVRNSCSRNIIQHLRKAGIRLPMMVRLLYTVLPSGLGRFVKSVGPKNIVRKAVQPLATTLSSVSQKVTEQKQLSTIRS